MSDSPASRMLQSVQSAAQPASQQWLQPPPDDPQTPQPPQPLDEPSTSLSDKQKLDTFESVLSEMEAEKQAVTPSAAEVPEPATTPDPPPQPVSYGSSAAKEQSPLVASTELPGGMQYMDSEPTAPEIPAEVESYLQKVEEQAINLPKEIVIAAEQHAAANQPRNLPQDVKVLPLTLAQAEAGKKKNTSFSIKWLVAFSEKLTEMFKGKAVYRQE